MGFKGAEQIQDVTFLSPVQDPKKQSLIDVLYKAQDGTQIIVEMMRPESLWSYCLKGEELLQKETERILKLIKPDVLPSESTHQCELDN